MYAKIYIYLRGDHRKSQSEIHNTRASSRMLDKQTTYTNGHAESRKYKKHHISIYIYNTKIYSNNINYNKSTNTGDSRRDYTNLGTSAKIRLPVPVTQIGLPDRLVFLGRASSGHTHVTRSHSIHVTT